MSNKDIRILLNTPFKEEGEEQLDELLPLAVGVAGRTVAGLAAKKFGRSGLKAVARAKRFFGMKRRFAGEKLVKGVGGTAKVGGKVVGGAFNAATGAAVIGAKAVRKGVEAGASGDVKKLGTRVGLGRRGEIRRRKAEAESIAQSVRSKLEKAQNKSGSQTNKPQINKPEPKRQPQGAKTAAEFDKEYEPNSGKVVIRSNTPYPNSRKGLKKLSRGGSPQATRVRRASMELTKQQKKAGMPRSVRRDSRQYTTDKRFS